MSHDEGHTNNGNSHDDEYDNSPILVGNYTAGSMSLAYALMSDSTGNIVRHPFDGGGYVGHFTDGKIDDDSDYESDNYDNAGAGAPAPAPVAPAPAHAADSAGAGGGTDADADTAGGGTDAADAAADAGTDAADADGADADGGINNFPPPPLPLHRQVTGGYGNCIVCGTFTYNSCGVCTTCPNVDCECGTHDTTLYE